jgi:DNA repair photolyase
MQSFDADRAGTGTAEWAETTYNVGRGCSNGCLYCYACANALRFKQISSREEWLTETLTRNAEITSFPARGGIVMFPSTHDITPAYLSSYIRVARLMLSRGNRLLIVTKPRLDCIRPLLAELAPWREQCLLRFTIGTVTDAYSRFWEPGAPLPGMRIQALYEAQAAGWRTSVSIEPMLEGPRGALRVLEAVAPYVTDTVWIGRMNKPRQRVDISQHRLAVVVIEGSQSDELIRDLVAEVSGEERFARLVRWKDSIRRVVEEARP